MTQLKEVSQVQGCDARSRNFRLFTAPRATQFHRLFDGDVLPPLGRIGEIAQKLDHAAFPLAPGLVRPMIIIEPSRQFPECHLGYGLPFGAAFAIAIYRDGD